MSDLKTVHLKLPASTADLRGLEIGSVAYLSGRLFTAREGVYKRAIGDGFGMPAGKDTLGITNFHCSPAASINPDGSYTVGAVTATASFRFAQWLDGWFKLSNCNIIIGKGGMTSEVYRQFFVPNNAIYLTTVGYGTGALLGRGILPATACSSARTPRSRRAWSGTMPAPGRRRCAATAKPTTRPRKSFEGPHWCMIRKGGEPVFRKDHAQIMS